MVIIESHKEWEKFMVEFKENDSVVIPIQCDVNKHPIDTELCLFYIRLLNDSTDEYIFPFKHSDTINLDKKYIKFTKTSKNVYTYDKKKLLHFVKWENVCDIQLMHYLRKNEPLMIDDIITNAKNLQDGIIRARYRNSRKTPELLDPNKIYNYELDLWSTSNLFKKAIKLE